MLKRFEITPSTVFELLRITDEIALCDKSLSNNLSLPLVSMYPDEIAQCPISHSLFALLANDDVNEDNESNSDEDEEEENKVNFIDQVVINSKSAEKIYNAFTKQSTFNPSAKRKRNNNNTERDSSLSKGSISSRTNRIQKSGVKYYNMNTTNSFDKSPERKDILTEKEFEQGYSYSTYMNRKNKLLNIKNFNPKLNNIDIVKFFYEGTDQNQIWQYLDYAEKNDMEGLMINLNTPYLCTRTKNLIKVKKFYNYDLEIIDIEESRGKLKGTLGAFVVKYKNNTINVGSGLTDEQRKEYWENKDNLIGKIIEIKYKEKTIDKKTGLESLQFPIFVSLRLDKKECSYE